LVCPSPEKGKERKGKKGKERKEGRKEGRIFLHKRL
jgi:hypothetical protein